MNWLLCSLFSQSEPCGATWSPSVFSLLSCNGKNLGLLESKFSFITLLGHNVVVIIIIMTRKFAFQSVKKLTKFCTHVQSNVKLSLLIGLTVALQQISEVYKFESTIRATTLQLSPKCRPDGAKCF